MNDFDDIEPEKINYDQTFSETIGLLDGSWFDGTADRWPWLDGTTLPGLMAPLGWLHVTADR